MRNSFRMLAILAALVVVGQVAADARDLTGSLTSGTVELKSAPSLAFGPQGILFLGDSLAATVHAVDTNDRNGSESTARPKVEGIDEKIASLLGTEAKTVQIKDLAVNPISGNTYLSVARGRGPDAASVVIRLGRAGKLEELPLKNIKCAHTNLPNAATSARGKADIITHMAYLKGRLLVAGMSNEEFASKLRSIPFPFDKTDAGTSIEIYHGAHGKFETQSPVRVFAPYQINGQDHLLAAYQCTPLVKLPVASLDPGAKVKATTVAELGNRNRPLSMIVYKKDGKDYVLMANSSRGLMKIGLDGVDTIKGITERIAGTAGLKYETIKDMTGVQKLDAFDKTHALVLVGNKGSKLTIDTVELP